MYFQPGDRVRWETTGDDGLPLVRYGFVGGFDSDHDHAVVMLDGDVSGDIVVDLSQLAPVTITTIELSLQGADLLDDPSLRQALVNLWSAEADQAGLEIRSMECLNGRATVDATGTYTLAEMWAGSERYVLRASPDPPTDTVHLKADLS